MACSVTYLTQPPTEPCYRFPIQRCDPFGEGANDNHHRKTAIHLRAWGHGTCLAARRASAAGRTHTAHGVLMAYAEDNSEGQTFVAAFRTGAAKSWVEGRQQHCAGFAKVPAPYWWGAKAAGHGDVDAEQFGLATAQKLEERILLARAKTSLHSPPSRFRVQVV